MLSLPRLILICLLGSAASIREDVFSIECESGHVDPALTNPAPMTNALCIQGCKTACANIHVERDLEACLSRQEIDRCLFKTARVHDIDTDSCVVAPAGGAPTIVFSIDLDDFLDLGDGSSVQAVSVRAETAGAPTCADRSISIGFATDANTDDRNCRFVGTPTTTQTFTVQDRWLEADITQLMSKSYQTRGPLRLFGTFKDTTCAALRTVTDVDVVFTMKYEDGYRPSTTCRQQGSCAACATNGCSWCEWSARGASDVPDWLPDWDFIEHARDDRRGQCGVNSAVCRLSDGRLEQNCGGAPAPTAAPLPAGETAGVQTTRPAGPTVPANSVIVTTTTSTAATKTGGDASGAFASLSIGAAILSAAFF